MGGGNLGIASQRVWCVVSRATAAGYSGETWWLDIGLFLNGLVSLRMLGIGVGMGDCTSAGSEYVKGLLEENCDSPWFSWPR